MALDQKTTCNISDCFLCKHCVPEWKEAIAIKKTTFLVKKGKQVFEEGEKVKGIFFIYSGIVKVHKQWSNNKELIIRFAQKGDILGHRGLGGNDKYPIGATALEETSVCFISNEFLEATLIVNPGLTYKLMHFYATELQNAEKRMRDLAHMDVKGRIADALFKMVDVFGVKNNNQLQLTVARQDIASYAGTTYETVFKFFNELTQNNIITTDNKSITILNADRLKSFIQE